MQQIVVKARGRDRFRLSESFLEPYRRARDPFGSILSRSTYLTKYCRGGESWTDTIQRVVEGNVNLAPSPSRSEAEQLFQLFWTCQALPPGRGLWTGGVPGIPANARYNCWFVQVRGVDDWVWVAEQLMLGGGVGVGLDRIDELPVVARGNPRLFIHCRPDHPNYADVAKHGGEMLNGSTRRYDTEDSREGWMKALGEVMLAAFSGIDQVIDVSVVRPRGAPIRTFGGVAGGPGPLTHMLRACWDVIRSAAGRKLTTVDCLDITNYIGLCVKAGNVRRSALMAIGSPRDQSFRDAKKDLSAMMSHRHTSNNSLAFQTWGEIEEFDWHALVSDMVAGGGGEPGVLNLPLGRQSDPGAVGVNPCGEVLLHNREACNLAEVFPAKLRSSTDAAGVFRLVTRYCLRTRLTSLTDPIADAVQRRNMRLGVGLGGICDFTWTPAQLRAWYRLCREEATSYANELGVSVPVAVTTTKPSGTISLLAQSSPGIHAPFARYYIRRVRLDVNDHLADALKEAGVPHEQDVYDQTGNTVVFSFAESTPEGRVTAQTQTLRDQLERQATIQEHWADNAVSSTITFDADTEQEELAGLLKEFVPRLKSTSCLPKAHGYAQPPYEAIDRATFERLAAGIDHEHPLVNGGDMELVECSGGLCPIR